MSSKRNMLQSGVVSIFVVIFSALFITIITVSFVSTMIRNQIQSTNADLSDSAYDAAMAGVEDAKRLMLMHRTCLATGSVDANCARIATAITSANCNTINKGLYNIDTDEVLIQRTQSSTTDDKALAQAYTCLKIAYNTLDLEKSVDDGKSKIVPLDTAGVHFTRIQVSWFKKAEGATATFGFPTPSQAVYPELPSKANWKNTGHVVPPILRIQLIQTGGATFKLSDFDATAGGQSNTNTLFLYPSNAGTSLSFANESRPALAPKSPESVKCTPTIYDGGGYACSTSIAVPTAIGGGNNNVYLRVGALYNDTDYKIELFDGPTTPVYLVGVQPWVDSTGRANDLFRRVKARVQFDNDFQYPEATLDINGNLCKNFGVTDIESDYAAINSSGVCTP